MAFNMHDTPPQNTYLKKTGTQYNDARTWVSKASISRYQATFVTGKHMCKPV